MTVESKPLEQYDFSEGEQPPWIRVPLLNVWVDDLSMAELLDQLDEGVVFTLNLDHLHQLQRNQEFFDAYRQADFITSDSRYVYWALRWLGRGVKEQVSGSDIVPKFCWHHRHNPFARVFLLGAAPGVAETARTNINARCGRNVVIGAHSPSMSFVDDPDEIDAVIDVVNRSGATVLLVGLGAPKQELWISKYRDRMPGVRVFMGVGATLDYEAGVVTRAPSWVSRCGLEWAHRVVTQPRRYWRRYVKDVAVLALIVKEAFGRYRSPLPIGEQRRSLDVRRLSKAS
jgi:N-acetylglucosaminyldiphosphoundecaprenol N-acetyl-beta-D-mannosaminyltransferase